MITILNFIKAQSQRSTILAVMVLLFIFLSCTDLDSPPLTLSVGEKQYDDPGTYVAALAKLYSSLVTTGQTGPAGNADVKGKDEGFSSYSRMIWYAEEFPTEEAIVGWNDEGILELYPQTWTPENNFLFLLYTRLFTHVAQCNELISNSTDAVLDARKVTENIKTKAKLYRSEARFLRALSYYYLLNLFRNVPLVDVNTVANHPQASPQAVFDFIEKELKEIEVLIPANNPYPRVTKGAVQFLLSRLYLNSEVFTGVKKYSEAVTYSQLVIDGTGPLGKYELEGTYNNLFGADNNTSKELIFAIEQDPYLIRSYGGTTFLIRAAIGGAMNAATYGMNGTGWGGLRVTAPFVYYFDFNKDGDTDDNNETDVRGKKFYRTGHLIEVTTENVGTFTNGYALPKYTNLKRDGTAGRQFQETPDTDVPLFRLGEAYLNYAEAVVRGGTGDRTKALQYVNALRTRASAPNIIDADLTLDFLKVERSRELHWESVRRTDLVRFGSFAKKAGKYWDGVRCAKITWLKENNPLAARVTEEDESTETESEGSVESGQWVLIESLKRKYISAEGVEVAYRYSSEEEIKMGLNQTQELIYAGAQTIYGAMFDYKQLAVRVDILQKTKKGWTAYLFKYVNKVKIENVNDVSVAYYVLSQCGLILADMVMVHFNEKYVRKGEIDVSQLFIAKSIVTSYEIIFNKGSLMELIQYQQFVIDSTVERLLDVSSETMPRVFIGSQCKEGKGDECTFMDYCLTQIGVEREVEKELSKDLIINKTEIKNFLKKIVYPICHMDFETIMPMIPLFDRSRPYQQIPFQYSLHIQRVKNGELEHYEYLAESDLSVDPRKELIVRLIEQTKSVKTILVYNQTFEKSRIKEMINDFPEFAAPLQNAIDMMVDLMVPIRSKHFTTESLGKKYSIKYVLPLVAPELSYDKLEINSGRVESETFMAIYDCDINDEIR
ncbi:hypothetical protein CHS0354_024085 [Potamilus streckersoni]|uniref:RagB/SusD family nutrient uptake outer membrane protein n=1 Tax=Potamilus streckersoni TaxID=2493646 RepID=A0AAE0S069_9BIVA|nr:hypothetical protein CHS0354_024085 [Potamilus streckersoni]